MRQRAFCALLGPMAKRLTAKQAVADVKGLRSVLGQQLVRHLQRHLDRIRLQERQNAHGNRQLFLSDIFVALLLAFYHPIVRSLRTIDALSCTQAAQQTLTINRIARSTLSDANRMVDPALLQPLLQDLVERVDFKGVAGDLNELTARLVAVDGTFFRVVGELLWTFQQRIDDHRKVSKPRLDVQLDLNTGVPQFCSALQLLEHSGFAPHCTNSRHTCLRFVDSWRILYATWALARKQRFANKICRASSTSSFCCQCCRSYTIMAAPVTEPVTENCTLISIWP